MHWCMDETLAVLALLPVIGFLFRKLHTWWHNHFHHKCHEDGCNEQHLMHVVHDEGPEPEDYFSINDHGWGAGCKPEWDCITQETIEARFGADLVQDLRNTLKGKPGLINLEDHELNWHINSKQELKVEVRGREFIHGYNQCEHGWDEVEDDTGNCCQGMG
jgi:hypothetical protein